MRKFLLLLALLISGVGLVSAQSEITVGHMPSYSYSTPFNNDKSWSWNETIYPKDEIGESCVIKSVAYNRRASSYYSYPIQNINIYMGETTKSSMSSTTDWTPLNQLTLVYSGSNVTIGDSEWETFTLNTPFEYSGEKNLVVVVSKSASSTNSNLQWYYTSKSSTDYVSLYRAGNSSSYSNHPSTSSGTRSSYAANIKFGVEYTSNQPLAIGNVLCINYSGYSLKYTITSVDPAECKVVSGTQPTSLRSITIPSKVVIKDKEVSVTSIGDYAFSSNSNLSYISNVVIPDGVTSIGSRAFSSTKISSIEIPSTVTSIGDNAFSSCSQLTNINFEQNSQLKSIGNYAYSYCDKLGYVEIPGNVSSIGVNILYSSDNLRNIKCYALNVPETDVNAFNNSVLRNISVPSSSLEAYKTVSPWKSYNIVGIGGVGDTYIENNGDYSLQYTITSVDPAECSVECLVAPTTNTSITLPSYVDIEGESYSVTSIENSGFSSCSKLTGINIPNSVTSIGASAFYYCSSLSNVAFGAKSQLLSIGENAFISCTSLTSITIPKSVTSIEVSAFESCTGLTNISVNANNTVYDSRNNCNAIIEKETNKLIIGCSNSTIPSGVVSIGDKAFYSTKISSVSIPNTVKSIGNSAFESCSSLVSLTFDANTQLTSIGDKAFYSAKISSVSIPSAVTSIGNSAFENSSSLASLTFDANSQLTLIGSSAFASTKISSVSIPSGVTSIGNYAFASCSSLASLTFDANSQLTSIGSSAFASTKISSVSIPSGVTSIGNYAFASCSNLASLTFDANSQLASIGSNAFASTKISSVSIPSGVTSLAGSIFYNCDALTSISIPDGITSIAASAFKDCNALANVAFGANSQLTTIGASAFYNCDALTSISIPCGVTAIGDEAFSGSNLSEITCLATTPPTITSSTFGDYISNNATLMVPEESILLYRSDANWGNFITPSLVNGLYYLIVNDEAVVTFKDYNYNSYSGDKVIPQTVVIDNVSYDVTAIGPEAFKYCINLKSIKIPYGITAIGNDAFNGCISLTSVDIPNTVTTIGNAAFSMDDYGGSESLSSVTFGTNSQLTYIGDDAFNECCGLISMDLPGRVTYIGDNAFYYCNKLERVTFGNNSQLTTIGNYTFYRTNLSSVSIPNNVTSIGNYAFESCPLTNVTFGTNSQLASIGDYAFSTVTLASVEIPSNVTYIGKRAFYKSLQKISCLATTPPEIGMETFETYTATLTVPEESVSLYKSHQFWGMFNNPVNEVDGIYYVIFNNKAVVTFKDEKYNSYSGDVVIPENVMIDGFEYVVDAINYRAFYNSTKLTSVILPNTISSIGTDAFVGCSNLTEINIPSSVVTIDKNPFVGCLNLAAVTVDEGNTVYDSRNNCNAIIETASNKLLIACDGTDLPEGIVTIGTNAYSSCNKMQTVILPSGVSYIENNAFAYNNLVAIVSYAEEVPEVEASYSFSNKITIYVPESYVASYKASTPWNKCTIKPIKEAAIGDNVTIEYYTSQYNWCKIKYTVTSLEPAECKVYCEGTSMNARGTNVNLPERICIEGHDYTVTGIDWIGGYYVVSVSMPNTITKIRDRAFEGSGISKITLPEGLISIGDDIFLLCERLSSVVLPNDITSIKTGMFRYCDKLRSIVIPDAVTSIEDRAFNCSGLENVFVPKAVKTIGDYAFAANDDTDYSLKSIVFEEGSQLETIGNNAFDLCRNLTIIEIPSSVTSIGDKAFYQCDKLANIYCYGVTPATLGSDVFKNISSNAKIYVPSASLDEYKTQWSEYSDMIVGMSVYTEEGWDSEPTPTGLVSVKSNLVIDKNEILNVASVLINDNASVTIKDGGQLACNDVTGNVIVEKEIEGYANQDGNSWYTIASPLKGEMDLSASSVSNIFNNQYDLYRYDEPTFTWQNYKNSANNGFSTLEAGRGYLYANSEDVTLSFAGNINTKDFTCYLAKDGEGLSGFNLIGNPFTHDIYIGQSNNYERNVSTSKIVFVLKDSYGDGWNGCKLEVSFSDGSESKYYTISGEESSATYYLEINNIVNMTVSWVKGSYAGECSFVIKYEDGTEIYKNSSLDDITTGTVLYTLLQSSDAELAQGYYTLSNEGAWGVMLGFDEPVKPCQGVLVKALEEGTLVIKNEMPQAVRSQQSTDNGQQSLGITVANGKYSDKAFVVFGKGAGLDKINHQNENIPMLYIPVDGVDYAIAAMDKNFNEIPVSFEAMTMGEYTISLSQENCEFTELYLLDKLTNTTVNILAEDYTFIATSSDSPERFVLLKDNGQQTTDNRPWVYVSNSDIVISNIEGNAEVNIFDAMGRCVYQGECREAANRIRIDGYSAGVYIIQKIDDNGIDVQKIIL